ncbi:hypothetical protein SAMN02745121_08715 [Nannocystis exedens]|uniref:Uncharacterized protein n=2 Tax=Nannocystis exedens TaxID=54 RepID=A0A1I2IIT2_9BACT|nr:hypothetical protein NAEX_06219 [Nannocystis exedens]SFF41580.1 hypothetical protein SAMN02745121_08715 [Nannocystis exedens]
MYTSMGTLQEVVAYFSGCCDTFRLTEDDTPEIPLSWRFARWLCERHGEPVTIQPAEFCAVLSRLSPAPLEALWHEFELFADEHLGVPRGAYPLKITVTCGYVTAGERRRPRKSRGR